jgi:hypothetical protein
MLRQRRDTVVKPLPRSLILRALSAIRPVSIHRPRPATAQLASAASQNHSLFHAIFQSSDRARPLRFKKTRRE